MRPQMLTLLRESRGLTGSELADKTGIPQSTLSKIENGIIEADRDRIESLAAALEYPVEALFAEDSIIGFGHSDFFHRKQQSLPQRTLRKVHASVNLLRMQLERMFSSVEIEAKFHVPRLEVDDFGSASEIARAVRAQWRMPMGPVRDVMEIAESAGIVIVRRDLESTKISAICIDSTSRSPALIVLNLGMPADRERFTIAHEIGHLVMHSSIAPPGEAEAEADAFAAEFLMPASEIRVKLRGIDLERAAQLKRVWKTSIGSIVRRARDLGVIEENKYKSLNVQISKRGWRKVEPVEIPRDEPSVVSEVVRVHLEIHQYSVEELAKVALLLSDELRTRYEIVDVREGKRNHLRAL